MPLIPQFKLPGSISKAQTLLLLTLLPMGLILILSVPVGGGFDEIEHLRRTWEMSALHFIPNSKLGEEMPVPAIYEELSYREQPIVRDVERDYWRRYGSLPLGARGYTSVGAATRSVYSPPLLLPQTLAVRYLGRKFDLPALPVLYGARLGGLLGYLALAYLAVRFIPVGKWTLAVLAAAPMMLFQASTVTADTLSNGFSLLFIGGALAVVGKDRIGRWGVLSLLGLTALLFTAKANNAPLALVPLLLVRPRQFRAKALYGITLAGITLLFFIEIVGWNALAYPGGDVMISQAGPLEHLLALSSRPFRFLVQLVGDLAVNGIDYLRGWIAAYGYYYWPVPLLVYWLWGGALVAAVAVDSQEGTHDRRDRWAFVGGWLSCYLATAMLLQFISVSPGSGQLRELQGRYLSGFMPLLPLAAVGSLRLAALRERDWVIGSLGAPALALFALGAVLSYHLPCGSSYYQFGLCYQPNYKNWSPELASPPTSPPLAAGNRLEQSFEAECDGLTEVRLWARSPADRSGGAAAFSVSEVGVSDELLTTEIEFESFPVDGFLRLTFEPQWSSRGRRYSLGVRGLDAVDEAPVLVYTQRPEYARGRLLVNGFPLEDDLFFQAGCLTGLARLRYRLTTALSP